MASKIINENVKSWEIFLEKREELKAKYPESPSSPFLFRGHKNAVWDLNTTLERRTQDPEDQKISSYYKKIYSILPQIETFTGRKWDLPDLFTMHNELIINAQETYRLKFSNHLSIFEYMIYLRHHGFPSPLLDWTRSPFIAAYFAFNHIEAGIPNVSIFIYKEHAGMGKITTSERPYIQTIGPTIRSHERHFLQQCEYTFSVKRKDETFYFGNHEEIYYPKTEPQDLFWKFTLPSSERPKVLKYLDEVNLNSFSIFKSEDGLIDTMAIRQFDLPN